MNNNASESRSSNRCCCNCSRTASHKGVLSQNEHSHCTEPNEGCDGQSPGGTNLKEAHKRRVTENSGEKNVPEVKSKRTKRNQERNNSKGDSKNKSPNSKQIMYYCEFCDTCTTHKSAKINDKLSHYSGKCMSFPAKFCLRCGLKFTNHMLKNHGTHQQQNLDYFKFFRWQDEKPLKNPPIPRYPYCAKCKVYFIPSPEGEHDCSVMEKKKGKTCDLCDKTYDEEAYEVHLKFHNGDVTLSSKDDVDLEDSLAGIQETDKDPSKKVEDINCGVKRETVINFFRCKTCAAAYHIKGYAERHKCGMSLRYCLICQFYVPEIHYKKHEEFHDKLGNTEFRRQITEF